MISMPSKPASLRAPRRLHETFDDLFDLGLGHAWLPSESCMEGRPEGDQLGWKELSQSPWAPT